MVKIGDTKLEIYTQTLYNTTLLYKALYNILMYR